MTVKRRASLCLTVLALAGCGGGGAAKAPSRSPAPAPATVAPGRGADAGRPPRGGRAQLIAELRRELQRAGPGSGAEVYDLTTDRPVFSVRAGISRPPASVEKLFTSVALLSELGPQARLVTKVVGTGSLGPDGTWHGNLYLRGAGDPTLGSAAFNRVWELGYGATGSDLAAQLAAHGIRRVSGNVIADESKFDPLRGGPSTGFAPDIVDLGGELSALTYNHGASGASGASPHGSATPSVYAAEQLALALRGLHVRASAALGNAITPAGAQLLASVSSPPLSVLLRLMDVPSDDFFAEMLTKELGAHVAGSGSIAAGARVITRAIAALGIRPRVIDGSGLSRDDRASPAEVVDLLRATLAQPSLGDALSASLPLLGVSGTTRRIAKGTVAQGRCSAKTGTLDFVTNLAGYCRAAGAQQLAFAIFIDGPSNQSALEIEGRMVADMVRLNAAAP